MRGIDNSSIICHAKFNSLLDCLICTCADGIGFELIDNILHQWSALNKEDGLEVWIDEFKGHILSSIESHAFYSIWLGLLAYSSGSKN